MFGVCWCCYRSGLVSIVAFKTLTFHNYIYDLSYCMLRLLEGITINWYLSIVIMTYENIILLIGWFQFGTVYLIMW